ncbi:MAG: AglZ/HisF2 family acetamidino modification protein [Candidatus Heimdallarchaeota archaeon]
MLKTRVIPVLLLRGRGLVKTVKFKDPKYVGDPINAVRIFNEKEVDELTFLDIMASRDKTSPQFDLIKDIATECFMPFGYGGGVRSIQDIRTILKNGAEKVILNSSAIESPQLINEAAEIFGSQSIVISIDVRKNRFGKNQVYIRSGLERTDYSPEELAKQVETLGAGEIIINSIDRDGTMEGYDLELIKKVNETVDIPVVACGGAGSLQHFREAVRVAGASAVAAGSMFVFHGPLRAVLINYPSQDELKEFLG